jgi:hypothetical protein
MRRLLSLLVGLLASLIASLTLAHSPEGGSGDFQQLQPANDVQFTVAQSFPSIAADVTATTDLPVEIEQIDVPTEPTPLDAFLGYRYGTGPLEWIVGHGNQFGMFSITSDHYQASGVNHGFDVGYGFHFLSGPIVTDMPPRLYDFSAGYQHRDRLGVFGYDVAASVMVSTDFEGSCREGIRYPGHAVGFLFLAGGAELVLGVDYLDRGDIKLLPVGGLILIPDRDIRLEFVFPRPRAVFQLTERYRLHVGGELGGGTWDIERATLEEDVATYRDLRLCVGLQFLEENNLRSAIEIGYLFDRKLEYMSGNGDYSPDDTAMLSLVGTF